MTNDQPPFNNSANLTVGSTLNITDIIPTANYTVCVRAVNCGGQGPEKCVTIIAPEAGEFYVLSIPIIMIVTYLYNGLIFSALLCVCSIVKRSCESVCRKI